MAAPTTVTAAGSTRVGAGLRGPAGPPVPPGAAPGRAVRARAGRARAVRARAVPVRLAAAAAAGSVLSLAFPPAGWWLLAVPAVAAVAALCRSLSVRPAAGAGFLFGLGLFLPLLHWTGAVAGSLAWVALAVLQAGFLALLGAGLSVVGRLPGWPLWGATLWVGEELLRSRLPFGGFPWGRLAFSQAGTPLAPLASLGGAPLVSFAVALLGGVLAALVWRRDRVAAAAAAGVALVLLGAPALLPVASGGELARVAIVQGNVPRLGLTAFAQRAAVLDNHVATTLALAADIRAGRRPRPDLVLWPENASDLDPYTDPAAAAAIDGAVRAVGVPVLVGAVLAGPGDKVLNSGIVWDPRTGPGERYIKQHPVPFGEYMPLRGLLRRISPKVDLVPRDFAAGTRTGVLTVGPARLGDVICFEVAYDGLVRDAVREGGRLLVVQTNNATFGRSGETQQQLAMGRLRAVEHGRGVLVAATSGISAVISPDGRVAQRTGVFTRDVLMADVPLRDARTPATRLGALPELLLALCGAAALATALAPAVLRR